MQDDPHRLIRALAPLKGVQDSTPNVLIEMDLGDEREVGASLWSKWVERDKLAEFVNESVSDPVDPPAVAEAVPVEIPRPDPPVKTPGKPARKLPTKRGRRKRGR